ncbi:xanthine dehydrogenase, C-terminal subunit [Parvularcula bermudensis HTCC2503]|uniref:Xanthine dehydrogenase, C-terminal subunit n=1 Tax=Parvularcula bermudensis (strain ATCC BAA-594 / HTCC2503 / KCTC 12087) TaxID=314260 RepID=E0TCX5_PARBH|nr:xanthine dehydrogenase molybdopterin binding subunit [Parvularcula bermudensis]ADM10358.1 xanthine dehydrogenase, C-terminal subunit [Parvularcula bermudensis HTCC2503]
MPDHGEPQHPEQTREIRGGVRQSVAHESAVRHVSGTAKYIDDLPEPPGLLHLAFGVSTKAHATILNCDLSAVRNYPGVVAVLTADMIPGRNDIGPVIKDDPLFAENEVVFHGQPIFAVVAESYDGARRAASRAKVSYGDLPAYLDIKAASQHGSLIEETQHMGAPVEEVRRHIAEAPHRIRGDLTIGGQDHLYLEGQIAMAIPGEDRELHVFSSTQNPTEAQHLIAQVLGRADHDIVVETRRMGGGFGGKETHPALPATAAALAASLTGRPVKCRLTRDEDMIMTGKRHDFQAAYEAGIDDEGRMIGAHVELSSRCGHSTDLSMAVNDRAMFHVDNTYFLGLAAITSHRYRTHTVSNTAFRGFGGPQGMLAGERMMDQIAFELNADPLDIRLANLYRKGRNLTPYGQTVDDGIARELIERVALEANYRERRAAIDAFNRESPVLKRGIALTPVKFGISFTSTHLNQAGALVHVYLDGSVQVNHGGTEMGQGLMTKVAQVVAEEFQIDLERIRVTSTRTDKVPNTSATAASSGSDLNGMAAANAAREIKHRLTAFAADRYGVSPEEIHFRSGKVYVGNVPLTFTEIVAAAYRARISLSQTGFYRTPKIHYDRATHRGRPFYYYAYGAAVSEVAIDATTGESRVMKVDILHDVGRSLNPAIDRGQIEGGFIQGLGWLTSEELVYDSEGRLRTHAPSTYKIPTARDRPAAFTIDIWERGENKEETIHRSKAVGEPPFMLAISVFSALTHAVAAVGEHRVFPALQAPATPEAILMAIEDIRRRMEPGAKGVS